VSANGSSGSVFRDVTGRRWRRVRRGLAFVGVVTTILTLALVASVLIPPLIPEFKPVMPSAKFLPKFAGTRGARARRLKREQLYTVLEARRAVISVKNAARLLGAEVAATEADSAERPTRVGFYVPWEDNSLASVREHATDLDWIVFEWAFVPATADTLGYVDSKQLAHFYGVYDSLPAEQRPKVMLMVSNYDRKMQHFNPEGVRAMLATPAQRALIATQLAAEVKKYHLGGVTLDLEEVPPDAYSGLVDFSRRLHDELAPLHAVTSETVAPSTDPTLIRALAAVHDKLFLMLYDEHYGHGDAGPIASQGWYAAQASRLLGYVPRRKAILAIAAYGYDWNDADPKSSGETMTFQEVMWRARENHVVTRFDRTSGSPYVAWTDPDSTDHLAWYSDAITGYNEVRTGRSLGAGGYAIWRLGGEDRAFWDAVDAPNVSAAAKVLAAVPSGYDTEFSGPGGEILRLTATPTTGSRKISADEKLGVITGEQIQRYPTPFVVERYGKSEHRVALTFDDGPDGRWTSQILDTLKSRGVNGMFFVVGRNVEAHIPTLLREVREGNEFGNHTFSHPNLAMTPKFLIKLEIDANERLLEALLNRRTVFFRPPFLGDANPSTEDELIPVEIATNRGYVTAGLRVDGEDWVKGVTAPQIIQNVLMSRDSGNVVLLHDGGGDRSATVAALGPLIDSLKARGDTIVLLSELAGIPASAAIPSLSAGSALARDVELASFSAIGGFEWIIYWFFLSAVIIGGIRLALIMVLAAAHRVSKKVPVPFTADVSVIVPAYNESQVISATIRTLLRQAFRGDIEIVVVDDGSPDDTYEVVQRDFGNDPRVSVYRKANGGKATALNYGLERCKHEIVICLDADTHFTRKTVARLIAPMRDFMVSAVAGNAKVGNRTNLVTRFQAVEYVTSQNLERRAFAILNCITVVPGAVGAWRKADVIAAGGFSDETLAEDQDLTLSLGRAGKRVVYAEDAIAYTEAPTTIGTLARQRFRWSFGTLQCAWKHRDMTFKPRYGALGMVALPNLWIFQLFYAAVSPLADLLFVWSLFSVLLAKFQHGEEYALVNLQSIVTLYALFLLVDWLAAVIAFLMEPREDKTLTWVIFLQRFTYRQVMYWVVLKSILAAVRGHVVGWGKLERTGLGVLPSGANVSG
jgi:cellulose synthase/poly-beta-1,6-N-acetylglucosamine synthase-like glycosyltransferase/peptidoglycan/xylan/chitin deacetylase (PgdA/CDA1 family)/spore germination protein YaaH